MSTAMMFRLFVAALIVLFTAFSFLLSKLALSLNRCVRTERRAKH